LILTWL